MTSNVKNMERGDNSWHQLIRTCAPACSHTTLPRTSLADTTGRVSTRARRQHTTFCETFLALAKNKEVRKAGFPH